MTETRADCRCLDNYFRDLRKTYEVEDRATLSILSCYRILFPHAEY